MTDILATIDAATDERCVCGCGTPLDPASPSAYWATEACQWAWQRSGGQRDGHVAVALPGGRVLVIDPDATRAAIARVNEALQDMADRLAVAFDAMRPALEQFAALARQVEMIPDEGPADPMERALWLRKNRNTGPKPPARAPKRLDARRSR